MSSYLPINSSTIDEATRRNAAALGDFDEFQCLATALCQRLKEGSMPPDDAYWWARTLCAEPYLRATAYVDEHRRVA